MQAWSCTAKTYRMNNGSSAGILQYKVVNAVVILFMVPAASPYMKDNSVTEPARSGMMLLLKGDGKMSPAGLSSTACGVSSSDATIAMTMMNAVNVTLNPSLCLNSGFSPFIVLHNVCASPLPCRLLYAMASSNIHAKSGVAVIWV